jgi:hypothetical protein
LFIRSPFDTALRRRSPANALAKTNWDQPGKVWVILRNFLKMSGGMITAEHSVSGKQASSSNVTLVQENRNLQVFDSIDVLFDSLSDVGHVE